MEQHKHLWQRGSRSLAKSGWRIIVTQLESMLQLSKAFARLHCCEEVTGKHVKEAGRFLRKARRASLRSLPPGLGSQTTEPVERESTGSNKRTAPW